MKKKLREEIEKIPEVEQKQPSKKDKVQQAVDILKEAYGFDVLKISKSRKYKLQAANDYLKGIYDIKWNADTAEVEVKEKKTKEYDVLDEQLFRYIQTDLDMQSIELSENLYRNLLTSGYFFPKYSPLKDYIFGLPKWDGETDHIKIWLQQIQLIDEKKWRVYFIEGFKRWFTALVMSLVEDRISIKTINHTCLVFQGKQGAGKSTFFENLIPEHLRLRYYQVGIYDFHKKEDQKFLGSKILIDLAELAALTRADNEAVKNRISQQHFDARLPWGKANTRLKRRCSFAASTNDDEFLTDITGDRRFFCVPVSDIDNNDALDVSLIWAQAYGLYKQGFKWWFDKEDIVALSRMNDEFRVMTQEEQYIISHFSKPDKKDVEFPNRVEYLMTKDISQWLCKKYERLNDNSTVKRNLGKALAKHGFVKVAKWINGTSTKLWQVVKHDDPQIDDEPDKKANDGNIQENLI